MGIAASYRTPKTTVGSLMPNTVRYSTRSLSYINKIKFLDTSPIASVSHDWLAGAELAGFLQRFSLSGRVYHEQYGTYGRVGNREVQRLLCAGGLSFCSVGSNDIVNRVEPSRSHRSDAVGGDINWQPVFDRIDLNGTEVMGGSSNGWTFGVNYYATRNLKFQLNYSYVDNDKYANAFGRGSGRV